MDSHLTMFFDRGYGITWCHKCVYTETDNDTLRRAIRIEQQNFEFSDELQEIFHDTKISIIKLN
jgi:hypothetical protein